MKTLQIPEDLRNAWARFLCEMVGTALLVLVGLSLVILTFGTGSPAAALVPSLKLRQILTGFLFGCVGGLITISRLGKENGAHMNPAVTFGFWMMGKMEPPIAAGYIVAQLIGAVLGCLPLLVWGAMGHSISFGATTPGQGYTVWIALLGEILTTFCLASTLYIFIACRKLRRFTPAVIPFLYAIMVPLDTFIGHKHESRTNVWSSGDFGSMGRLVDLLGWAARRRARFHHHFQLSHRKNRRSQAVPLRV